MIKLTNKCNLGYCRYCYTESKPSAENGLDLEVYKTLIEHLVNDQAEGQLEELSLTGGEPFLRKDILELVDFALAYKISTRINTNGTLATDAMANRLCKLAAHHSTQLIFQFGLDSADVRVHEYIRGKDTFESTVEGVGHVSNYQNEHTKISLRYTIMKKPFHDRDKVRFNEPKHDAKRYVEFANSLKANKIKIRELLTSGYGYGLCDLMLSATEVAQVQRTFIDTIGKYPGLALEITWPSYFGTLEPIPLSVQTRVNVSHCRCMEHYLTIDVDGGIVGCVLLIGHPEQYLGNILKDDIIKVFNSSAAQKMLNERYRKGRQQSRCYAIDHTHDEAGVNVEHREAKMKGYHR